MENLKQPLNRAGVIDIGSHSLKLIIGESDGATLKVIETLKHLLPIGKDTFYKNVLTPETIKQIITVLNRFKKKLEEYAVTEIKVFATTAVREARNRDIFLDTVQRKTGFKVEIFTTGDVVFFIDSYIYFTLKDVYPIHEKNVLITEQSAGTAEFSVFSKNNMVMSKAAPLGTLQLKQMLTNLSGDTRKNYQALAEYVASEFDYIKRSLPAIAIDDFILISEDLSYCIQKIIKEKRKESMFLTINAEEAAQFAAIVENKSADELVALYKLPFDIAEIAGMYSLIINNFLQFTSLAAISVLETSLYEAVLSHMLLDFNMSKHFRKTDHLIATARELGRKYNVNLDHAEYVVNASKILFSGLKDLLDLQSGDFIHLQLAAWLHDIGMFISNRAHHKHSEYIILSLNLFRLNEEDLKAIAAIARYHRKGAPSDNHPVYASLPAAAKMKVQKLSALLRIANSFDRAHKQKLKDLTVTLDKDQNVTIEAVCPGNTLLEENDFDEKKSLFESITGLKIKLKVRAA